MAGNKRRHAGNIILAKVHPEKRARATGGESTWKTKKGRGRERGEK